jgi:uncharacterized cofD-like protein
MTRDQGRTERRDVGGQLTRWLRPGMGVKRWLAVVFGGELLLALAGALVIRQVSRDAAPGAPAAGLLDSLTLQFLPFELRLGILLVAGLLVFGYGSWRLLRVLVEPYQVRDEPLVELLYQKRLRARGPHVVAIGGGTGLSVLLRGLKELTSNITAVVTVADDGGSSGVLRQALGVPPMGDIRNCMAALADAEPAMARLLQYRFPVNGSASPEDAADGEPAIGGYSFGGHAFGNLLITAMTAIEGDFEEGVRQSNRVLAVRGKVVPAAGESVTLHAELDDGTVLVGQSVIARAMDIRRVWITPVDVRPSEDALEAIANADLVIVGPGSLYTSLMPSLLMTGMRQALEQTAAQRIFVCNVATQVGETHGYRVSDHLAALRSHGLDQLVDAVLANNNMNARAPSNYPAAPVEVDVPVTSASGPMVILRDVVDDELAHHHDPHKLAATLLALYDERVVSRLPQARSA